MTPPASANLILIERRTPVINGRSVSAAASLRPDGAGVYRGGSMWFNPIIDRLPTGRSLDGTWGSTYLKLALHEWMHFVGLGDLDGTHPESLMGGATAPDLSIGDHRGLVSNGCYSPGERARLLRALGA